MCVSQYTHSASSTLYCDKKQLSQLLGFISSGFLFRLSLEILYVSSEIFSGVNLITKQNFHRVTILRLRVKSLSRLILVNKKAGGCSWAC